MANDPSDQTEATPSALAYAKELGIDINKIGGTGKDGKVTKADVDAAIAARENELRGLPPDAIVPVPPKVTRTGKLAKGNNYFCLESTHGGGQRVDIHDMSRHFTNDTPNCPSCGRSVSALVVDDPTVLPPSIQLLKDRLSATEAR